MAKYIKTMVDANGDTIYPRTRANAVMMSDGAKNLETKINEKLDQTTANAYMDGVLDAKLTIKSATAESISSELPPELNITIEEDGLSAHLKVPAGEKQNLKESNFSAKKIFVNIQDDDGRTEALTVLKPLLDEYGFKASFAINSSLVGTSGYLTWAQIATLESEGHEILNHTIGTDGTQIVDKTLEQLALDYASEKASFIANGLANYDYLVYAGTQPWIDAEVRNKISAFYKCSFANNDAPYNYIPFDNYAIRRGSLVYKAIEEIDTYLQMGTGFVVLYGHAWQYTGANITYIRSVFDKIVALGAQVEFVTAKSMVDNFENIINLGNLGSERFMLDKNGNMDFSIGGVSIQEKMNTYFPTDGFRATLTGNPITLYPRNCITFEKLGSSFAVHHLPQSGVIKTVRFKNDATDTFAYQEYSHYTTGDIYKRVWLPAKNDWSPFAPYNPIYVNSVATRPKYMKRGYMLLDSVLGPLWARFDMWGYQTTAVARSTVYALNAYIRSGSGNYAYKCIVAGTTSDIAPTYTTVTGDVIVDGTAQFECVGFRASFTDVAKATVYWDN